MAPLRDQWPFNGAELSRLLRALQAWKAGDAERQVLLLGGAASLFCGLESVLRIDRKAALTGEGGGGGAEGGAPGGEEEEEEDEDGMFKIDLPSVARQARMSDEEAAELESRTLRQLVVGPITAPPRELVCERAGAVDGSFAYGHRRVLPRCCVGVVQLTSMADFRGPRSPDKLRLELCAIGLGAGAGIGQRGDSTDAANADEWEDEVEGEGGEDEEKQGGEGWRQQMEKDKSAAVTKAEADAEAAVLALSGGGSGGGGGGDGAAAAAGGSGGAFTSADGASDQALWRQLRHYPRWLLDLTGRGAGGVEPNSTPEWAAALALRKAFASTDLRAVLRRAHGHMPPLQPPASSAVSSSSAMPRADPQFGQQLLLEPTTAHPERQLVGRLLPAIKWLLHAPAARDLRAAMAAAAARGAAAAASDSGRDPMEVGGAAPHCAAPSGYVVAEVVARHAGAIRSGRPLRARRPPGEMSGAAAQNLMTADERAAEEAEAAKAKEAKEARAAKAAKAKEEEDGDGDGDGGGEDGGDSDEGGADGSTRPGLKRFRLFSLELIDPVSFAGLCEDCFELAMLMEVREAEAAAQMRARRLLLPPLCAHCWQDPHRSRLLCCFPFPFPCRFSAFPPQLRQAASLAAAGDSADTRPGTAASMNSLLPSSRSRPGEILHAAAASAAAAAAAAALFPACPTAARLLTATTLAF